MRLRTKAKIFNTPLYKAYQKLSVGLTSNLFYFWMLWKNVLSKAPFSYEIPFLAAQVATS